MFRILRGTGAGDPKVQKQKQDIRVVEVVSVVWMVGMARVVGIAEMVTGQRVGVVKMFWIVWRVGVVRMVWVVGMEGWYVEGGL